MKNKKLYFLIELTTGGFMLAEKLRSEKWVQVSGNSFSWELQNTITKSIDKISADELLANAHSFDELPTIYVKPLLKAEEQS